MQILASLLRRRDCKQEIDHAQLNTLLSTDTEQTHNTSASFAKIFYLQNLAPLTDE